MPGAAPDPTVREVRGMNMRNLDISELELVSGAGNKPASHPFPPGQHPNFRNPAKAPGNSYKGPANSAFDRRKG